MGAPPLGGFDLEEANLPTLDEAVARYAKATGRQSLSDLHWYFAYNLFRAAGIVQGIKKRLLEGNASSVNRDYVCISYVEKREPVFIGR